jgi:hypothetical protein
LIVNSVLSGTTPIGVVDSMPYFLVGFGSGLAPIESSGISDDGAGGFTSWNLSTSVDLVNGTYTIHYNLATSGADMTSSSVATVTTYPGGQASHHTISSSGPSQPAETVTFLGEFYQFENGAWDSFQDLVANTSSTSLNANFTGSLGGYLSLSETHQNNQMTSHVSLFHHDLGYVTAHAAGAMNWSALDSMPWQLQPRMAPAFLPAVVWVNGNPFLWSSGQLYLNGQITEVYQGPGTATFQLQIESATDSNQPAVLTGLAGVANNVEVTRDGATNDASVVIIFTDPNANPDPGPGPELGPSPVVIPEHPTVWINGHAFDFAENEISEGSYFVDRYDSAAMGCLRFSSNSENTSFIGNCGLISVSGELPDPLAPVSGEGFVLTFVPPPSVDHIQRLWIRGTLYQQMGFGSPHFVPLVISGQHPAPASGSHCTLSLAPDGQTWQLGGGDQMGTFSGVLQSSQTFLITNHLDQVKVPVVRVDSSGAAQLGAGSTLPSGLPASVLVPPSGGFAAVNAPNTNGYSEDYIFRFVGLSASLVGDGSQVALYLKINQKEHNREFLQIAAGGADLRSATILKLDPVGVTEFSGGYFSPEPGTLLFYRANTEGSTFPLGVKPLLPDESHCFWRHHPQTNLSPSYVIRGQGWHYAGTEQVVNASGQTVGVDVFHGPILGQVMRVFLPNSQGTRLVTLADPTADALSPQTIGSLNPVRDSVTFRDGTVALRGNVLGLHDRVEMGEQLNVHTIQGDLDVLGNHLSFGLLHDDAGLAGALFRFTDQPTGSLARLESTLGRNQAEWGWSKSNQSQGMPAQRVMQLRADHKLHLADPLPPTQQTPRPGITLDPSAGGTSSIPGVLRVRPGGDLSMGQFQAGGQP